MTITMKSYGITWTDPDGTPRAAAVSYDQASADDRKAELETGQGLTRERERPPRVGGRAPDERGAGGRHRQVSQEVPGDRCRPAPRMAETPPRRGSLAGPLPA